MKNKKTLLLGVILVTIVVGIVVLFVLVASYYGKKELEEYTIENHNVYFYTQDTRVDFTTTLTLKTSGEITKALYDGDEIELPSSPLYYEDRSAILLPKVMDIVLPTSGLQQKKLPYYTMILDDQIIYHDKTISNLSGFLYDGDDIYFFLEPVSLDVDGTQYSVSKYSFVNVDYHGNFMLYDYEQDAATFIETVNKATASTSEYTIYLSVDTYTVGDNGYLLIHSVSDLVDYE